MLKILFVLCFSVMSQAQLTRSSVSLSTGGAGVAAIDAGEATFSNPASIMHMRGRYFFTTFQKDLFALSLLENDRNSAVPGALGYEKYKDLEAFNFSLADRTLGALSVGISLKYYQLRPENLEQKRSNTMNGNMGFTWAFGRQFGVGAAFENIAEFSETFKEQAGLEPRTRLGLNYIYKEWFRTRLDVVTFKNNNFRKLTPQVGFESYFGQWMIGRMGWFREPGFQDSWTVGFGMALPRFKIDYAYQSLSQEKTEIRHSIDLGVPF